MKMKDAILCLSAGLLLLLVSCTPMVAKRDMSTNADRNALVFRSKALQANGHYASCPVG